MQKKQQIPEIPVFKPSEYHRTCHPDLFSDTTIETEPLLGKDFFEWHLATLTQRKHEIVFEDFCRRLAELEICPNLKPQTGPTGGGDSKTDASTYPVAPVLAERCYWGSPNPPSNENWAFAFSCKKQWKGKAKDDVKKIFNLDRKFTKVFFISNQAIRDKDRANTESELSKQYAFEVHILDSTWIVNKIFEHKHEEMAIDALGIDVPKSEKPRQGPNDTSRQQELDGLLKRFKQPEIYCGNDYALAQDYLKAAITSRGLEKSRHEIDGFFNKAKDIAKKYGYRGQIIRVCYQYAWTSLWWFDDFEALENIYNEMEEYLPGTEDAEECELFLNLWLLLLPWTVERKNPEEILKFEERRNNIQSEADRLSKKTDRSTNALNALTILHEIDLYTEIYNIAKRKRIDETKYGNVSDLSDLVSLADVSKIENAFKGLKKCLKKAKELGMYPLLKFCHAFEAMGERLSVLPGYNELYDEMLCVVKERSGEMEEGKLLYSRGMHALRQNDARDVLRYMGRARIRLLTKESIERGIHAALICSEAYRIMGLYWAARMEALIAANFAMQNRESIYEYPKLSLLAAMQMGWLELKLGRVAPFIAWYELSSYLVYELHSMQQDISNFEEELEMQESVLGCFFS